MYTWLSRIMTVVFLLNVFSPAYAQGNSQMRHKLREVGLLPAPGSLQSRMGPNERRARSEAALADRVTEGIKQSHAEYIQSVAPSLDEAAERFRSAVTYEEMEAAYARLNAIRGNGSIALREYQGQMTDASMASTNAHRGVTFGYYQDNPAFAPDAVSQTVGYDARFGPGDPKHIPLMAAATGARYGSFACPSSEDFLQKLQNNEFEEVEDMLNYMDPVGFNCNDYLAVAYAAETLFYMLEEFTGKNSLGADTEQFEELKVFFAHERYRAIQSLSRLETVTNLNDNLLYARGTLRILIARLDQVVSINNIQIAAGPAPDLKAGFLKELKDLRQKNPSSDSAEFTLLQVAANYAAQFATLTDNGNMLNEIVSLFEETSSRGTDYHTHYSDVLGIIFTTVQSTLKDFRDITAQTTQSASIYSTVRNLTKLPHGTDTRVLAISTLAGLHEGTYSGSGVSDPTKKIIIDPGFDENGVMSGNKIYLSQNMRQDVASSIAQLLNTLQRENRYYKDYGLDSEGMQALVRVLLANLSGLLPVYGEFQTPPPPGNAWKEEYRTWKKEQRWITDQDLNGSANNSFYLDSSKPRDRQFDRIYIFDSNGDGQGPFQAHSYRNTNKYSDEITNKGMEILGEAMLWLVGGEIVGGAFRGLRLLWGVSKSLPRAIKAGKIVYNTTTGTRIYRATAAARRMQGSLKVGSKYMSNYNFNNYLARNGMSIEPELFSSPAGSAASTALGPKLPPSPVGKITFTARDVTGAARGMSLPLFPGARPMAKWTVKDRVFSLRAAQRMGLRNTWTAADRALLQENMMFSPFIENATFRHPITGNFVSGPMLKPDIPLGSLLSNEPMLRAGLTAYGKTLRFFTLWQLGDITTGMLYRDSFNRWMIRKQQEAMDAEVAKYDVLSPESIAELEAQDGPAPAGSSPSDILSSVGGEPKEGFSWVDAMTLPSWVWHQVAPTEPGAVDGSMILPPFIGGKYALSQMGMGSNPFMTDAMRAQIGIQARQTALAKARIGQANTRLNADVDTVLANIAQDQSNMAAAFASLKKDLPGDWSAEEQAYQQFYNEYAEAVKEAGKIVNLQERSQRLEAVYATYAQRYAELESRVENKQNAIVLARIAPEGELAFWKSLVEDLQTLKENTTYTAQAPDVDPVLREKFLPEYCAIIDGVVGKIKVLSQKNITFTDKLVEWEGINKARKQRMKKLFQKYNLLQPSTLDEPTFSDNLYGLEGQEAY